MPLIHDLLDLQIPKTIRISPNAQQILYSTTFPLGHKKGEHEQYTLWLAETGEPKSSRQVTSGQYCDQAPRWLPDGSSIAFISDRAKQSEQWAIWMLPANTGGEAYPLTPVENESSISRFELSADGKFVAYISADEKSAEKKAREKEKDDAKVWGEEWPFNRLRLVHVATKKVTTLVSRDANVVDLAWNDDGTKIAIAETRTPDIESQYLHGMKISIVDVGGKQVREVCSFPNSIENLSWASNRLYFLGFVYAESCVSAQMVYSVDVNAESATFQKFAHGEDDCAMELGRAGSDMTVLVQHDMEDQIRMLKGKTLYSRKKEILVWDAAFTKDSDEMILAVAQGDASTPPEVYSTTASGGAMVQVSNHGEKLLAEHGKLGTASFLRCPSFDGKVELDGVYITPTSQAEKGKPLPTVLWIHGVSTAAHLLALGHDDEYGTQAFQEIY